jgi:hypothetical protein
MNSKSKPRKTASKRTPKDTMPETSTATLVSADVQTMFTNPELFARVD